MCGLRWGGMDDLEVESVALDKGFLVPPPLGQKARGPLWSKP